MEGIGDVVTHSLALSLVIAVWVLAAVAVIGLIRSL